MSGFNFKHLLGCIHIKLTNICASFNFTALFQHMPEALSFARVFSNMRYWNYQNQITDGINNMSCCFGKFQWMNLDVFTACT